MIPCLDFDAEGLDAAADDLKTGAGDLRDAGDKVVSTWGRLQTCYRAPEQERLYAAMDPVSSGADSLASDMEEISSALATFAEAAQGLRTRARTLRDDVKAFKERVRGQEDWQGDQDLVDESNRLLERASSIQADLWEAERVCASKIRALDSLPGYHPDSGKEGDQLAYGATAADMRGAQDLPWGSPVERDKGCAESVAGGVKRFLWDGVVVDGLGGTINGVISLAGIEVGGPEGLVSISPQRAAQTWQALSGLVGISWGGDGPLGVGLSLDTASQSWKELGKGMVSWDQWKEDPARAAGSVAFDVVGTVATVGAAKAGSAARAASRVGRAGQAAARAVVVADRVLGYMDPVGSLVSAAAAKAATTVIGAVARHVDLSALTGPLQRLRDWATTPPAPHTHDTTTPTLPRTDPPAPTTEQAGLGKTDHATTGQAEAAPGGEQTGLGRTDHATTGQAEAATPRNATSGRSEAATGGEQAGLGKTDHATTPASHPTSPGRPESPQAPLAEPTRTQAAPAVPAREPVGAAVGARTEHATTASAGSAGSGHPASGHAGATHGGGHAGATHGASSSHTGGGGHTGHGDGAGHSHGGSGSSGRGGADGSSGSGRGGGRAGSGPGGHGHGGGDSSSGSGRGADGSGRGGADTAGSPAGRRHSSGDADSPSGRRDGTTEGGRGADTPGSGGGRAGSGPGGHGHGGGDGSSGSGRGDGSGNDGGSGSGRGHGEGADGSGSGNGSHGRGGSGHGDGSSGHGDGAGHGEGDGSSGSSESSDSSGRRPSVEELVEERRRAANEDKFNKANRPKVHQTVEVGADSPLAPSSRKPFGRGVELEPSTCYHVEGRGDFYTNAEGRVTHVEAHSAVERRGWWGRVRNSANPDLCDPLPEATYTVDGRFHYTTDEWGRTVRLEASALDVDRLRGKLRLEDLQGGIGRLGGAGFDGGHLVGTQFGGAPEAINVVPMHRTVNQGTGGAYPDSFKALEADIKAAPHAYRDIVIEISYDGPTPSAPKGSTLSGLDAADRVPTEFEVSWVDETGRRVEPKSIPNEDLSRTAQPARSGGGGGD